MSIAVLAIICLLIPLRSTIKGKVISAIQIAKGRKTVADRVAAYGQAVFKRLEPAFQHAGVRYPPQKVTFIALKQEKRMEVWASDANGAFRHLTNYPIQGASGKLGPKLAEGDRQVPEGIYKIEALNPNSSFHLSLRLNYPNAFDREQGRADGRTDLGSDIMIHGTTASIGCLAMGNEVAEDLFVLAAKVGIDNMRVIISPVDFRIRELPQDMPKLPRWTERLYADVRTELNQFRAERSPP